MTIFSDTLETARPHLESGALVVLQVEATMEADQLKLLARSVAPIDTVVADAGASGLRVYLAEPSAIAAVAGILDAARRDSKTAAGRGPIYFCLMDPTLPGEVEIDAGSDYPVTPQIKGALRSLNGVIEVEEV